MHNGRLGVIGFKIFECSDWVEDGILLTEPGRRYALSEASVYAGKKRLLHGCSQTKVQTNSGFAISRLPGLIN